MVERENDLDGELELSFEGSTDWGLEDESIQDEVEQDELFTEEEKEEIINGAIKSRDLMTIYLVDVRNDRLLTFEEEIELAKRITDGDEEARIEMATFNVRLVIKEAKRHRRRNPDLPMPDLVSCGNVGLMIAVDGYDHRKGFRFSTYAMWWIRQCIGKGVYLEKKKMGLPLHVYERIRLIKDLAEEMELRGEPVDYEKILDAVNQLQSEKVGEKGTVMSVEWIEFVLNYQGFASMEKLVGEAESDEFGDTIEDRNAISVEEQVEEQFDQEFVRAWIERARLSDRQKEVIKMRFGFSPYERRLTLDEVSERLGFSRETVRLDEGKALEKLNAPWLKNQVRGLFGLG